MLQQFLAWFVQQLAELLPPSWRDAGRRLPDAVVARIEPGSSEAALAIRRGGRTGQLGTIDLEMPSRPAIRRLLGARAPSRLAVQLPAELLLERPVTLPIAAEGDFHQVIGYEVDRYTPFAAGEMFWSAEIERRDRPRGRLHLKLFVVPRAAVQPALEALETAGLAVSRLEIPAADGTARVIDLGRGPSAGERLGRRALQGAAIACLVLALVATGLPFFLQWQARSGVESRIALLSPRVQEYEALRRRILGAATGADTLAAEQARVGDTLEILATLTRLLPDDTYLTGLTLRQRKVSLEGQSASAAKLISLLADDPLVRNPSFAAPIVRNDRNAEVFSIRAEMSP